MNAPAPAVAEMQGLYGPFSFPEKLLQKIWLRGDFERATAVTTDGRRVRVLHPGKWNLLGGPDFRGARLRLGDGPELTGDIELHLRAADWVAHAHAQDRNYDGVVLHVVLFPPEADHVTRAASGAAIPVLALLPLLHHDLEEFAAEEAVERLAGRPAAEILEALAGLGETELAALLGAHAAARWRQKVHFARLRVTRLGWDAACHHAALEILGYRFNRAPMLQVAGRWPLSEWARGRVVPDEIFTAEGLAWSLQGVRPANHPRGRLRQYAAWTQARPDWPSRLTGLGTLFGGCHTVSPAGAQVYGAAGAPGGGNLRRGGRRHALRQSGLRRLFSAVGRPFRSGGWRCGAFGGVVVPLVSGRCSSVCGAGTPRTGCVGRSGPAAHARRGAGFVGLAVGAGSTALSKSAGSAGALGLTRIPGAGYVLSLFNNHFQKSGPFGPLFFSHLSNL